jgi:hypothetical protein
VRMWRHWYFPVLIVSSSSMVSPLSPSNLRKVFKRKDLRPDFPAQAFGLNEKVRLSPDFFVR